jgi:general stress protein 26
MALQGDPAAFAGTLWFFTDSRSRKAREIAAEPQTSVILQCDKSSAYLHLAGRSTLVIDRAKMRELFTPKLKTWFPNGLDDPYLTLMRFDADGGYFWDGVGGRLQALGALTRALVTGIPGRTVEAGRLML